MSARSCPTICCKWRRTSPRKSAGPRRVDWSAYARRLQLYPGGGPRITRAFRANQAALDVFPTTLWAQVVARRLRRASAQLLVRRRGPGIPSAASGGRRLPERLARSEVFRRPGADHFRRAGSAGARCPPAARSRRSGMGGRPGLSGCGHCFPGSRRQSPPRPRGCGRPGPGMGHGDAGHAPS